MKLYIEKKIIFEFIILITIIILVGAISFRSIIKLKDDAAWVEHSERVKGTLESLLSNITDVENGKRGFVITGNEEFLEPYYKAVALNDSLFRLIRYLTADNNIQQKNLDTIAPIIKLHLKEAEEIVELRRLNGFKLAQNKISEGKGKLLHDQIRQMIRKMENIEQGLLVIKKENTKTMTSFTLSLIIIFVLLSLIASGFALFFLERDSRLRYYADQKLIEANEKLMEVDRLKSQFLATMSHELRTPLNSIIGFTGILLQGLAGPLNDEQKKQLSMSYGSAKHLLSLINDILDISRIESGKFHYEIQSVNIKDIVFEVKNTLKPQVDSKGIHFIIELPDKLPEVQSDRKRVFQILLNLANNAVKFTDMGEVKISCTSDEKEITISVSDTGMGIKPENLKMLFEAFRQVDGTSQRKYEGTGLGLYLSKKLVELLGGKISAESEFGVGSKFTFTIPLSMKKKEQ